MDWPQLIKELADAKVTQAQIAEACGVTQSTVSEVSRGIIKSPSYTFGTRLIALHGEKVGRAEQTAPTDKAEAST